MKYSYLVILSFLVLLTALCYVFWWNKGEEESSYVQEDTRLILTAEYLKKHPRGIDQSQEISDSAKYVSYVKAVHFERGIIHDYPYSFVVVNLIDENTGVEKEICLTSDKLKWLIRKDKGLGFKDSDGMIIDSLILTNKSRRFYFQHPELFDEIHYEKYSASELANYRKLINIDSVKEAIFTNPFINHIHRDNYSKQELDSIKSASTAWFYAKEPAIAFEERRMLAHIMFNHGIPMGAIGLFDKSTFKLPREKIWMDWIYQETNWQRK